MCFPAPARIARVLVLTIVFAIVCAFLPQPALLAAAAPAEAPAALPASILADPVFQEEAKKGLDALYDMDFAVADEVFKRLAGRYPDHPVSPFLRGLLPWWAMQLEPDDTSQDAAFLADMEEVIDRCDRRLKGRP